jgi:uncharacterized protein (DUF1330 family)
MKAYWIAHVDVTLLDQYGGYMALAPAAFALYGGRYLARGGRCTWLEGAPTPSRNVVIEFDSYEQALACYHSPEYQAAAAAREGAAEAQIVIVEGVPL